MRAACILQEEYNLGSRILNIPTLKPVDKKAILKTAEETGIMITCEEHLAGRFRKIVVGVIVDIKKYSSSLLFDIVGVDDKLNYPVPPGN